jgi:precorrin-6B methylase 2
MYEPRDPPYPELKKSHTMAHTGRPWTDYKPPAAAPVWAAIEGLGRYYILSAALELDVFDTLERTGPVDAHTLAAELRVSASHLGSLLDAVVALGLLDQFVDRYELNDTARRYLLTEGPASMAGLVPVAPGPHDNWTRLADTVRNGRPATPIEDDPAAFYVPLVEGTFTTMFRCASRADLKVRYSATPAPRVLDLGAGGAPWSIAILTACQDGTAIINDLPGVIDVAQAKIAEHGVDDRCELRPGDFHTIDIEPETYDLVVLGHVCRTEGADGARHLIERAYAALRPEGRLILCDYFPDMERKFNPHAVLMGRR